MIVHSRRSLFNFQATQMTENEQRNIYSAMPQLAINQHRPGKLPVINDFDKTLGQPASCLLAAKLYEEHLRDPTRSFEPNLRLFDVSKFNLLKSPVSSRYFGDVFVTLYHIKLM